MQAKLHTHIHTPIAQMTKEKIIRVTFLQLMCVQMHHYDPHNNHEK